MPTINIALNIKFRALFTDLYKFSQSWSLPLPALAEAAGDKTLLKYNDRGVNLVVTLHA